MAQIVAYPVEYGQRHVVLIVEGDPGACRFLCDHLKRLGFHAVRVAYREEAEQLIDLGVTFDIVVSDAGWREGVKLARWILERAPNLPLILIASDGHLAREQLCGAEVFAKPYTSGALARKIRDTLQRNRPRPVTRRKRHWQAGALLSFAGRARS